MRQRSEEVQGVGVIGMRGQDLPIERLGFRQSPGFVMLECDLKGFWDGHGGYSELEQIQP